MGAMRDRPEARVTYRYDAEVDVQVAGLRSLLALMTRDDAAGALYELEAALAAPPVDGAKPVIRRIT